MNNEGTYCLKSITVEISSNLFCISYRIQLIHAKDFFDSKVKRIKKIKYKQKWEKNKSKQNQLQAQSYIAGSGWGGGVGGIQFRK